MASDSTKVTVNLPRETLAHARAVTGKGIRATVIEGLEALGRRRQRSALRALRGQIRIDLNLPETRR